MQLTKSFFSIKPIKWIRNREAFLRDIFSKCEAIGQSQLLKKFLKETLQFSGCWLFLRKWPFCWGGLNLQPNFQNQEGSGGEGWQDLNFYREVAGKVRSDFFQEGDCNFSIKNKWKSEKFNEKKAKSVYNRKYFSLSQLRN